MYLQDPLLRLSENLFGNSSIFNFKNKPLSISAKTINGVSKRRRNISFHLRVMATECNFPKLAISPPPPPSIVDLHLKRHGFSFRKVLLILVMSVKLWKKIPLNRSKKKKRSEVNILTFIKCARYRSSINQRQAVVGIENTF